jgi:hypothetical protein
MKKLLLFALMALSILSCKDKAQENLTSVYPDISSLNTFGTMGKELQILKKETETELFSHQGKGCLTHMWFGGDLNGHEDMLIRVYVDGEEQAGIEMELFLGHGIGFKDNFAPWGTEHMGNMGRTSGIYNTYKIPFSEQVRITAQLASTADVSERIPTFWWIIRGTENLPLVFNGVKLPDNTRLRLHKLESYTAKPLEEFTMAEVEGAGMLYQLTMQAKGLRDTDHWKDLSFMESCIRAYEKGEEEPMFVSSGLEDYFLGTYYFNTGRFANKLAGLTHFDPEKQEFSAYRLHTDDPIFFQDGLRLTNRCGEKIGDKVFHDPPPTRYTVYTWIYEW